MGPQKIFRGNSVKKNFDRKMILPQNARDRPRQISIVVDNCDFHFLKNIFQNGIYFLKFFPKEKKNRRRNRGDKKRSQNVGGKMDTDKNSRRRAKNRD